MTGGAGSIGSEFVKTLSMLKEPKAIRVFDCDEYGLFNLNLSLKDPRIRLLMGDVKDRERVKLALQGVDIVVHFAAVKNLDITEYNVPEAVRTNVLGTINMIEESFKAKPEKFLFISSDKSIDKNSLYGATKFIGEKLILWAHKISDGTSFSCTRFGNVIESRGNVFDVWKNQVKDSKPLTITNPNSKRYYWHVSDAVHFILNVIRRMDGGEIFVPPMEAFTAIEMANKMYPGYPTEVVGLRHNEIMNQELLTDEERSRTYAPPFEGWTIREE